MIKNWKENTIYISLMQLTLLGVNFFLITIISKEYGAEIYGEYAASKSLSVLIGTATVLSLALVVTKLRAQNVGFKNSLFANSYFLVLRNLALALVAIFPLTILFGRDYPITAIFLTGFVFNEMIHIALAYFQADGNFVITSKQIIVRTILYGFGAWIIVINSLQIIWVVLYQSAILFLFFLVAHYYIPKTEKKRGSDLDKSTRKELNNSGRKMVLTTFSSALISELDIVLLGLFYFGPALGVLAWSRRILEIIFQLLAASLDILFPELSKAKDKDEIQSIRERLKKVFFFSFIIPVTFYLLRDTAGNILVSLLGEEFTDVSFQTSLILFSLPLMVWSRINIIFSRALGFEVNITKIIISGSVISYIVYFALHNLSISNPAILSIISSQMIISMFTSYSFRKSYA
ncbi:hypothetical protein DZA34_01295 [Candidatus Actinomarina sp. HD9-500m-PIT-SAG01]|nr:hypothetical protein DZA34_01295 [Candidatus Actinomarina sp. HD9-500m-PIT-SAG01]